MSTVIVLPLNHAHMTYTCVMQLGKRIKHPHTALNSADTEKAPSPPYSVAVLGQARAVSCCHGQKLQDFLPPLLS